MKLTIDDGDKGLPSRIPRMVQRSIDALVKLPDGKLRTMQGLASLLNCAKATLQGHTAHPALSPYKLKIHRTACLFGNPKTIAEARKELPNAE